MKEYVICKSCGYIMEKSGLKDKCPACGVPSKMFESYIEKVSEKRKAILSLDLHPIMVHFSISFSFSVLLLNLILLFISGEIQSSLKITTGVLSICLPLTVLLTFFAGIIDGRIRFRRVTTPILKRKIILGISFFLLSVILLIINISGNGLLLSQIIIIILSAGCMTCGFVLGIMGKGLINAKFPG
jgi:hypothetical protein